MNREGRFAGRGFLAALPLAALLALAGCATATTTLRGQGGTAPAAEAPPPSPMKGRPLYSLTAGRAAQPPPSAAAPPFTVPPFSPADEIAGRWLLLFELSYPAEPSGPAGP